MESPLRVLKKFMKGSDWGENHTTQPNLPKASPLPLYRPRGCSKYLVFCEFTGGGGQCQRFADLEGPKTPFFNDFFKGGPYNDAVGLADETHLSMSLRGFKGTKDPSLKLK